MKTSRQNAKAMTAEQIAEQEAIMEAKLNGTYITRRNDRKRRDCPDG